MKSEHGRGLDWPISYADVAPYYDRVAREIGVSGDAKAEERWRPPGEPYPMPPLKTFRHGEVWVPGFKSVGITVAPGAVGVNSTEYQGRAGLHPRRLVRRRLPDRRARQPAGHATSARRASRAREVRALSYVTRDADQRARHARDRRRVFTTTRTSGRCRRRAWSCSPPSRRRTRA